METKLNTSEEEWALMVDIDSLFDTRLATILGINKIALKDVMLNGYFTRELETFYGVDTAEYFTAYKKRNKLTLQNSMITKIIRMVIGFNYIVSSSTDSNPGKHVSTLILNTYPYRLLNDEVKLIISGIIEYTGDSMSVTVVHMKHDSVTPNWLKANVSTVIMYNYRDWLDVHTRIGTFERQQCPEVTLIAPKLIYTDISDEIDNDAFFSGLQAYMSLLIKLELLPVAEFCINIDPDKLK